MADRSDVISTATGYPPVTSEEVNQQPPTDTATYRLSKAIDKEFAKVNEVAVENIKGLIDYHDAHVLYHDAQALLNDRKNKDAYELAINARDKLTRLSLSIQLGLSMAQSNIGYKLMDLEARNGGQSQQPK